MSENKFWLIVVPAIAISTVIFLYLFFQIRVETMSVRSKDWYRVIKELEDYKTYECHSVSRTDGNGKLVSSLVCDWKKHTRTINTWTSQGTYPEKPYWRSDYSISPGHYESRYENYIIHLSDDKAIWNYSVNNEGWYDTFPVREKCLVGINWFNIILKVEC